MADPVIRPMSAAEFGPFITNLIREYAEQKVLAGEWPEEGAAEHAARDTAALLPQAQDTPGMVLLTLEAADGTVAGQVWVAVQAHDGAPGAWIYDIQVEPEHRGRGYSRALMAAAERAAAEHGATAIGLNVSGRNAVARRLYETSGYEISALQMRKPLAATDDQPERWP
jgi:ribosomal protein S18 acetylase RimI-like enzyme